MKFTDLIPDPNDLLNLEPEELAGYLTEYLNSLPLKETETFNRGNLSGKSLVLDYK